MSGYIVSGKLGSGKTLCAIGRAESYLKEGCIVATNIDIRANKLELSRESQRNIIRIPDQPTIDDLNAIGRAYDIDAGYDETKTGLLMLDELATWFNARAWSDPGRKELNNWLVHARKLGWDVFLIIQNIEMLDKQARQALCDYLVVCKRTDRFKILGFGLPKAHMASVYQGHSENPKLRDSRWLYKGLRFYDAYDTAQVFTSDYPHNVHSVLPAGYFDAEEKAEKKSNSPTVSPWAYAAGGAAVAGLASMYLAPAQAEHLDTFKPSVPVTQSLIDQLGPLEYGGSFAFNGEVTFLFSGREVGEIDSGYFERLGAKVSGMSMCSVSVSWPDGSIDVVHCNQERGTTPAPSMLAGMVPSFLSGE